MKKIILSFVTVLLFGGYFSNVKAQDDISNIFKAGVVDLNSVAKGYLTPAGNSFSTGLGSDWYNTAAVHKTWGFDITFGVGVVQAPQSDQNFSLTGLTNLKPTIAGTTQAPSFAGNGNGVELNLMQPHYLANGTTLNPLWDNGNGKIISFNTPGGVSRNVPTASIQLTLGLPFINDVSFRFMPKVNVSGFQASLWGIGIKHNFKQWIPVIKDLPFDAAIVVAYSKFNMNYAFPTSFQITPDKLVSAGLSYIADPNLNNYTTQGMKVSANAQTANLVFSKKLLFITPYVGFGVTKSNFDLAMVGNYPTLGDPVYSGGEYKMQIKNITDPVKISSNEVMTNLTLGIRLKVLWIATIHAQYEIQKYPVATVGFGLTMR